MYPAPPVTSIRMLLACDEQEDCQGSNLAPSSRQTMTELDASRVPPGVHGYPRPDLQRDNWMSLNGTWDFGLDAPGEWRAPSDVQWSRSIQVPFSPETRASGVMEEGHFRACWYRRVVDPPAIDGRQRLMLHFGAVD